MIVIKPIATNFSSVEQNAYTQQGDGVLRPGKIIDAVVLSSSSQGQLSLRIGHSVITASTSISLRQNAHLQLEVLQIHPQLLLRLVSSTTDTASSNSLRDAMLSLLSRQSGLAPSLAGLINRALVEGKQSELASLRSLVNSLDKAIPGRNNMIHTEGLRKAMLHSGLFLEALLARSAARRKAYTSRDIKACLLRLQYALEHHKRNPELNYRSENMLASAPVDGTIPPKRKGLPVPQPKAGISHRDPGGENSDYIHELLNRTKGAIARLGYLQAISAENIKNGEYMWQVEIPVKHRNAIEMVSMSVEKEHRRCSNEDEESWIIRLAVDLPQLGPVEVRISKFKQGVSTCFWSDSARVRSLIEGQFERLKSNLEQHGVRNLHHACLAGSPTPPASVGTDVSSMDVLA